MRFFISLLTGIPGCIFIFCWIVADYVLATTDILPVAYAPIVGLVFIAGVALFLLAHMLGLRYPQYSRSILPPRR